MVDVVLASNSPRRKEMLDRLGVKYRVIPAKAKEKRRGRSGQDIADANAYAKLMDVREQMLTMGEDPDHSLLIAADTAVVHKLKVLGKPRDKKAAANMIRRLQGDAHFVITSVAMAYQGKEFVRSTITKVIFTPVGEDEIEEYVKTKEPMDKAGAYGIQGYAARWIRGIEGDYYSVVGFPIRLFYQSLPDLGLTLGDLQK